MQRVRFVDLNAWLHASDRKPLVIQGARQVGKTWLVRQLAQAADLQLIEFNFEVKKQDFSFFRTNDPHTTIREISASRGIEINPCNSLLFLDEIQVVPELLAKLRWFAEEMPQLAVIATGSLLDFALHKHSFSMPVGRINYCYLEPLSFEEFLLARDKAGLLSYLVEYEVSNATIPAAIHDELMSLFKEFVIVGGLPAVVANWCQTQSLLKVSQIQQDLLTTYRDDFGKYRGRVATGILDDVLIAIPKQLGQKFVYQRANPNVHSMQLRQALQLLSKARVSHQVVCTHANGLPLAAETNEKYFKAVLIDVGLCSAQLGLGLDEIQAVDEINLFNKGAIAEQVVGQLLRTIFPHFIDPTLYCWMRTGTSANAELDYIVQHKSQVIPLEVKAGKTGTLKSLHYFMQQKGLSCAVRVNSDYPSHVNVTGKNTSGKAIDYRLLSIPFYLLGQIHRLLEQL